MQNLEQYYDELPYDFRPVAATRPENIESVARLHGLSPAALSHARILELGGASGGNLMPVAIRFPGSSNVCMDLSGRHIRDGEKLLEQCGGLQNFSLRQASITDIDAGWGQFDYIICHGVMSWVPEHVQEAIWRVCRENLAPNGIALVSYNAYPGWKTREILRDAMLHASRDIPEPLQKLRAGREMLADLRSVSVEHEILRAALNDAGPMVDKGSDAYLLHEFFEPQNSAFYLQEIVAKAAENGLSYVGDSAIATLFPETYPRPVQEVLRKRNIQDPLDVQQFLDFAINRTFRQSLFTHADLKDRIRLNLNLLSDMHFAGQFSPAFDERGQPIPGRMQDMDGMQYLVRDPAFATVLEVLSRAYPATVHYGEIRQELQSRSRMGMLETDRKLAPILQMLVVAGSVGPFVERSMAARSITAMPVVPAFMREQLRAQMQRDPEAERYLTWSLTHHELALDRFGSWLAIQLNGTRDIAQLIELTLEAIHSGAKIIPDNVGTVDRNTLQSQLPHSLENLRRHGLIAAT